MLLCDERILCRNFKGKSQSIERGKGQPTEAREMAARVRKRNAEISDWLFRSAFGDESR